MINFGESADHERYDAVQAKYPIDPKAGITRLHFLLVIKVILNKEPKLPSLLFYYCNII